VAIITHNKANNGRNGTKTMKQLKATINRLNKLHFKSKKDYIKVVLNKNYIEFYSQNWLFMKIKASKINKVDITPLFNNF
jgi:hypothetical protein